MYISLYIGLIFIGTIGLVYTFICKDKPIQIITSIVTSIIFILTGLQMFSGDLNLYTGDNVYITNCGWIGTLLILIGVVMCLFTILIIYQIFASEKINDKYLGTG